ncbi:MAG: glutathione S-transferase family protein [Pseudomonadota bacterium]
MRRLYHWTFDPASRAVRLALGEKRLEAELVVSPPWKPDEELQRLAPGASTPVLLDQGGHGRLVAGGARAVLEYLDEARYEPRLLPGIAQDRAEIRRIWEWVETGLADVGRSLVAERVAQWERRDREPDAAALRVGSHALRGRMTFLNALCESRPFLAGRALSVADLVCAAHLSAADYFGDVPWDLAPDLRDWYARMKSRPSFRSLLADRLEGARPASHYADLDF